MNVEDYLKSKDSVVPNINYRKYFKNLIKRTLCVTICVLLLLIISNISLSTKNFINKHIFETNFNFSKINSIYKKFVGSFSGIILPVSNNNVLSSVDDYYDGCVVGSGKNETIKLLDSGIVVFIGEKENYGNTIIVQQSNGVDVWYGGIKQVNVTLYSYLESGTGIGLSNEEYYLVFQKNGEFLDYKNFI